MFEKRKIYKAKDFRLLRIVHFFTLFKRRHFIFKKTDFGYDLNTRKRNIEIGRTLHKNIIKEYFNIYFNELYHNNGPKYFFLSGFMEKGQSKRFFHYKYNEVNGKLGIGLVWYRRLSLSYLTNVLMRKPTGPLSGLRMIEDNYRKRHNVEDLKYVKQILKTSPLIRM